MERKWTPGPWECLPVDGRDRGAFVYGPTETDEGCFVAPDAHLIAAAPDMYELVDLVHSSFGGGRTITFSDDDIAAFSAVLAKARGEA